MWADAVYNDCVDGMLHRDHPGEILFITFISWQAVRSLSLSIRPTRKVVDFVCNIYIKVRYAIIKPKLAPDRCRTKVMLCKCLWCRLDGLELNDLLSQCINGGYELVVFTSVDFPFVYRVCRYTQTK